MGEGVVEGRGRAVVVQRRALASMYDDGGRLWGGFQKLFGRFGGGLGICLGGFRRGLLDEHKLSRGM